MSEQRPPEPVAVAPKRLSGRGSEIQRWMRLATNGLIFLVLVVLLGLSNIFIMLFVGMSSPTHAQMKIDDLVADGGLFFFAMTLLGGSLYSLMTLEKQAFHLKIVTKLMYISFFVVASASFVLVVQNDNYYMVKHTFPFGPTFLSLEKAAAGLAVLFALVITLMVDDSANSERPPSGAADGVYRKQDAL